MTFGGGFLFDLAESSLRALGLGLLAWVVLHLFRLKSAAAQHAVWTLVTLGMLLLAFRPMLPPIRARVLPALPVQSITEALDDASVDAPAISRTLNRSAPTAPFSPLQARNPQTHPPRISAAVALYTAGVAFFLIQFAGGFWLLARLRRNCRLIRKMDGVPVYECGVISVPMATGCLRARILLPRTWHGWNNEKLHAALVHERTHIRRADWAISIVAALNRCIFWFHPLAWWLERQLGVLAEEACDDAAVLALGDRAQYAQTLLEMARAVTSRRGRFSFAGMNMAGHQRMRERIERLLDETREIGGPPVRKKWAIAFSAALPLLYLWAAFQPARMAAQIQPKPNVRLAKLPASAQPAPPPPTETIVTETTWNIRLAELLASSFDALADAAFQPAQNTAQAPPSLFRQAEANALAHRASGRPNETTAVELLAEFYSATLVRGFAGIPGPYSSPDDLRDAQASLETSSDGWVLQRTAAMLIESGFRGGAPASVRIDWHQYPKLSAAVAYGVHLMQLAQQLGEGGGGVARIQSPPSASSRYACEPPKPLRDFYFMTAKRAPDPAVPLHQALASDPDNVFLNYWMVRVGGDVRDEYRQKLAAHPDDPAYLFYYGQALMTGHFDPDDALPYLERSVAIAPDFPWNYPLLAHIHSIGNWADQAKLVQDMRAFANLCTRTPESQLGRVHDANALRELAAWQRNSVESYDGAGIGNQYPLLWSSELRLTPAQQYRQYANQVAIDLGRLRQIEGIDPNAMADGEALLAALEH